MNISKLQDKFNNYEILIYIRNCSNNEKLNFSNLSFIDKEDLILLFLQSDINLNNKEFINTWIYILTNNLFEPCIFDEDEKNIFINNNLDFINIIKIFISSIINNDLSKEKINISEYNKLNVKNVYNVISSFDEIFLYIHNEDNVFFEKILSNNDNKKIINNLLLESPYCRLLLQLKNMIGDD